MAHRRRHRGAAGLAALVAVALCCTPASAGTLVASAPGCVGQALSKPFWPWLDPADYTPLPGGAFEPADPAWSTTGAAGVVAGNSPYGASEGSSLALPAGSSATSATICVGLEHPTMRFFARRSAESPGAILRVETLYEYANGAVGAVPAGFVLGSASWQPTPPLPVVANLLALLPGEHTPVAFRFSAIGGDWTIDDVYVDPYARR